MYALHLRGWLDAYRSDQLLIVQQNDLERTPKLLLANVSAFLGSSYKYDGQWRARPKKGAPPISGKCCEARSQPRACRFYLCRFAPLCLIL